MEPPGHKEKAKAGEHLVGEGVQQEALAAGLLGVHEPCVEGPRAAGVAGVELQRHPGAPREHQQVPVVTTANLYLGSTSRGGSGATPRPRAAAPAHGLHPARSTRGKGGS